MVLSCVTEGGNSEDGWGAVAVKMDIAPFIMYAMYYLAMPQQPMPGWYKDPSDASRSRWWDGQRWTDRVLGEPQAKGKSGGKPWYQRAWLWLVVVVVLALVAGVVMWPKLFPATVPVTPSDMSPGTSSNTSMEDYGGRTYGGNDFDIFSSVVVAPDGDIIAVGVTSSLDGDFPVSHGKSDAVVARFTPAGVLAWSHTYGGSDDDSFISVAVTDDGSIIAVGDTWSLDGDFPIDTGDYYDAVVVRLTPDGALQWSHTYGGSGGDSFISVAVETDGSIIAAGLASSKDGDFPIDQSYPDASSGTVIVRMAPDGGLQWAHTLSGNAETFLNSVAVAPDGSIIAAGFTTASEGDIPVRQGGLDAVVVRLTPDGGLQWSHTYGGSDTDHFSSVAVAPDGTIIATGDTKSPDGDFPVSHGSYDAVVAQLTPEGALQWARAYGGADDEEFSSVAVRSDGTIIVAGETRSPDGDFPMSHGQFYDALIAQVGSHGDLQWFHTYGGTDEDDFLSVTMAPDGSIVAVGGTSSPDGDFPMSHGESDAVLFVLPQF